MKIYKGEKVEKKILTLVGVLVLAMILVVQITVFAATNDATQNASSNKVTTIAIKDQAGSTEVSTITFPAAAPSTEVTDPWNDVDTVSSKQAFGGTSLPVVWLVSATTYDVHVTVTEVSGWDAAIVDENILISDSLTLDTSTFDSNKYALSTWGTVTDISQQVTTTKKYLYLTINLDALAGKTGQSTISILGETP